MYCVRCVNISLILKTFKTFSIQVISKINAEFLQVLFEILKRDIVNLMASIIQDVARSKILKKYAMILKLLQIAIVVAQLINDYRKCKSLLENILLLNKTTKILTKIKEIEEFNIGHFIIGESIFIGLLNVIKNFKKIIKN